MYGDDEDESDMKFSWLCVYFNVYGDVEGKRHIQFNCWLHVYVYVYVWR